MRHIIVTGVSQGLGLAILTDLLAHGFYISACSRSYPAPLSGLVEQYPAQLFWQECDVANAEDVDMFVANAVKKAPDHTELWGLINNAGVATEGVLATFPNTETDALLATNLHGPIYCARAFLRQLLVKKGAGRIINISSIIGSRGYTGLASYSASKAGLDGLTRALARENGRRGITVNSVAPGYLETEMSSSLADKKRQQIINRTPLNRLGTVADITPIIRFFLSDDAAFITGQTLTIDGGITN